MGKKDDCIMETLRAKQMFREILEWLSKRNHLDSKEVCRELVGTLKEVLEELDLSKEK